MKKIILYILLFSSLSITAQTKPTSPSGGNKSSIQKNEVADPNVILPPSWAFGLVYGGYTNQKETIETVKKILEHDYPIDAYWIDSWFWSYEEKGKGPKKYLDFIADTISYPNREKMWGFLKKNNIKGGFWIWDCILKTGNETAFNEFDSLGYFSKKYLETNSWHNNNSSTAMFQEGSDNKGTLCGNIDFENPEAIAFFKSKMKPFFDEGADFLKLDRTAKIETVKTIFEISQEFGKETKGRGFMLSHSFDTDSEEFKRYPAKWTDDTRSDWNIETPTKKFNSWVPSVAFKENIEMFTNPIKKSSKIPFLANDSGGFDMGITDRLDEELYIRWVQFSTFNPIMEIFSQPENSSKNLAFNYSERANKVFRQFSHLRMELFPYIYSYALTTRLEGKNMIRPIDGYLYQFYFGAEFLVAPVYKQGSTTIEVYFPEGNWVNFWTNEEISGGKKHSVDASLDIIPLYVKKGSIIPMRPYASSIEVGTKNKIILHVFPGEDGKFKLLEDDGTSNDYLNGIYAETIIQLINLNKNSFKLKINKSNGYYKGMPDQRKWDIIIHSDINYKKGIYENGKFDLINESNNILKGKEITILANKDFEIIFR
jgi:alpha-glucosidase (family GH31 glycosyl hydrolase)